jgi:hypothetical protein
MPVRGSTAELLIPPGRLAGQPVGYGGGSRPLQLATLDRLEAAGRPALAGAFAR